MNMNSLSREGYVYKAVRFSIHDGPGIRTLFFFQGCPLNCLWCCNPESRPEAIQKFACQNRLLQWQRPVTIGELVDLATRDIVYYRYSGGGVTLTGGEVLLQDEFARELLYEVRKKGIHTAIETSGYSSPMALNRVLEHVDLVLLDIKHIDSEQHRLFTGVDNKLILNNAQEIHSRKIPIIIRIPLIPGYNDSEDILHMLGCFVRDKLPDVRRLCLLKYHNFALNKYREMNIEYPLESLPIPTDEQMMTACAILQEYVEHVQLGG